MAGRKELLSTIEQQRNQISKYESKLKDVVQAYKGLLKEKEALQSTLTALSSAEVKPIASSSETIAESSTNQDDKRDSIKNATDHEDKAAKTTEEGQEEKESDEVDRSSTSDVSALTSRIVTLTTAINTINAEKSRIETSFQSDKKRLLGEKEKLEQKIEENASSSKIKVDGLEEKIKEMKSRIIVLQHERDQETNNFTAMLREVESRLAVERTAKEKLEQLLEDMQDKNKKLSVTLAEKSQEQHQKQITDLQNELEQVRGKLKRVEKQCEEPPILVKLQNQIEEMSSQHTTTLHQEQVRTLAAERNVRELSHAHEDHVAMLEGKIAELSSSVAQYDRTHQSLLETIQSLKGKIRDLSYDNSLLKSRSTVSSSSDISEGDSDVSDIVRKMNQLWDKLHSNTLHSDQSIDYDGLLPGREILHKRCQQEYDDLKTEFEKYKLSIQQSQQASENKCGCGLTSQVEELKDRLRSLTSTMQLTHETHTSQIAAMKMEQNSIRANAEENLKELDVKHKSVIMRLEQQLSDHRQRSLTTLQDRDQEIHRLTLELHQMSKLPTQPGTVVAALLSQVGASGADGPLLHHLEESARKDMEISHLRREKRQAEKTMREVQLSALTKQEAQQDKIDFLEAEVERYKRNTSRKGENLEYLKNVVLQYMTSSDGDCRSLMLNAIAAVLKFTDEEVDNVRKYNTLWWWQAGVKNKSNNKPLFNN